MAAREFELNMDTSAVMCQRICLQIMSSVNDCNSLCAIDSWRARMHIYTMFVIFVFV